MRTVAWVTGIGKLTKAELYAAAHAAERIGTDVSNLVTCIGFETGTSFSPSQKNRAGSGAVGLIQFMPSTARALGTTVEALGAMTFTQQLEYVVKYFSWFKGKDLSTLESLYCAIFWPAAIDKPDDYVIGTVWGAVYRQNAGFDLSGNKDGKIARAEVCAAIRKYRATADDKPAIEIPDPDGGDTSPFSKDEWAAILELVSRTVDENLPNPLDVTLADDDPPPTERNS